jgi:hypothetical protein
MTVRLRARQCLLVGLAAAFAGIGGIGCVDKKSKSDLDPEGPPKILQVFVRDFNDTDDPVGGEYALAYGVHEDALKCSFEGTCECPMDNPECILAGTTCDTSESSPTFNHCTIGGKLPTPRTASAFASIRVVSKELLRGTTLEQFACACHGACPAGMDWAIDPENCSACGDDPATTISEAGQCLDVNHDRVPDISTLQAGVATITCGTVAGWNPYTTKLGDGYYYPSGNQFPTSGFGYGGIGPALVIEPADALPTSQTCTVSVSASVTDKDGNAFEAPSGAISFTVEALAIAGTAPEDEEEDVDVELADISITYNVPIDPATATAANIQVKEMGGAAVAIDSIMVHGPVIAIMLVEGTPLKPNTTYEVTVSDQITDAYGIKGPAGSGLTFTFTTAAAS